MSELRVRVRVKHCEQEQVVMRQVSEPVTHVASSCLHWSLLCVWKGIAVLD